MPGAREVLANSTWGHGQGRTGGIFSSLKNWTNGKVIDEVVSSVPLVSWRLINITDLD